MVGYIFSYLPLYGTFSFNRLRKENTVKGCGIALLLFFIISLTSWAVVCGILYAVALCFGLAFKLSVATGIWLILFLLSSIFSK